MISPRDRPFNLDAKLYLVPIISLVRSSHVPLRVWLQQYQVANAHAHLTIAKTGRKSVFNKDTHIITLWKHKTPLQRYPLQGNTV